MEMLMDRTVLMDANNRSVLIEILGFLFFNVMIDIFVSVVFSFLRRKIILFIYEVIHLR